MRGKTCKSQWRFLECGGKGMYGWDTWRGRYNSLPTEIIEFMNLVKSNQTMIVPTIFRLDRNQTG